MSQISAIWERLIPSHSTKIACAGLDSIARKGRPIHAGSFLSLTALVAVAPPARLGLSFLLG